MGYYFDISGMLGNASNSSNSLYNINLADYASIKNGSYGKLTKSYYAEKKSDSSSQSSSSSKTELYNEQLAAADKTGLTKLKQEADGLKTAAEEVGKAELYKAADGSADMDKIASAVKKYASEYNDVLKQYANVSSTSVDSSINNLKSMTSTMSKALDKIGVSVGADGKLSVDEDKLKSADVNTVKSLFSGQGSYGQQIEQKANDISKATILGSSIYGSDGSLNSSLSGLFNQSI